MKANKFELPFDEMRKIEKVVDMVNNNDIHIVLKKNKAELHIKEWWEYAWIQCGNMSYYFHKNWKNLVKHEEYETMKWKKNKKTVVPYDWWERWC